jgi:hypothetical protein
MEPKAPPEAPPNPKQFFVSRFKPIGECQKCRRWHPRLLILNWIGCVDEPNGDQMGDQENSAESCADNKLQYDTQAATDAQAQAPIGIAAAGFKKFVKKSISIKIKATDSATAYQSHQTTAAADYPTYTRHYMTNDYGGDETDEVEPDALKPRMYDDYYDDNELIDAGGYDKSTLYDYNYDLDDDLYNLNTLIEKSKADDDEASCSSNSPHAKKQGKKKANLLWNYLTDSSVSLSGKSELSEGEVVNKKSKAKGKRRTGEAKKSKQSTKEARRKQSGIDRQAVGRARDTLRHKLESYIDNMTDSDADEELREILENLLLQIDGNDALTMTECEEIDRTFSYLEAEVDDRKRAPRKDADDERESARKRKRRAKSSGLKRKKSSTQAAYVDDAGLAESADMDELEAGEIDELYDDELVIEKELQSLLKQNC